MKFCQRSITASVCLLAAAQIGCSGNNSARSAGSDSVTIDDSNVDNQTGTAPIAVTATNLVEASYDSSSHTCSAVTSGTGTATGVHCYVQVIVNGVNLPADIKGAGFDMSWTRITDRSGQTIVGLNPALSKTGLGATYQFRATDNADYDLSGIGVTATFDQSLYLVKLPDFIHSLLLYRQKVMSKRCQSDVIAMPMGFMEFAAISAN